jgi:electron-transferring-flavoprotein dehydrogenase
MGFPLVDGSFGGGFVYGMKDHKLTIGLIISLDSENPNINPQQRLQDYKKHPWIQEMIKDGKLLKYGAALLPEGGYYSLPKKFTVKGAMLLGDALGVLDISRLSGIDKAMECGYQAAEVLHGAIQANDFLEARLSTYQDKVMNSFVGQELKEGRYFRHAWQENPRLLNNYLPKVMEGIDGAGPISGLLSAGLSNNPFKAMGDALRLKSLMEGRADIGRIYYKQDYQHIVPNFTSPRSIKTNGFVKETVYSRADAVFYANTKYHEENRHIDEFKAETCVACISKYDALGKETPCVADCTAEVHRIDEIAGARRHGMSLENCVQCRTCEIVCPEVNLRVRPTEQGAGPDFMGL